MPRRVGRSKALRPAEAPGETYTRFTGARWTPTRFLNSAKDDPEVPFPARSSGRRRAPAGWITDRRNPTAARVAASRICARHMGPPLVPRVFYFGRKREPPSHPELLDWLASELIESGWSMKHLHRSIVESAACRPSSSGAGEALAEDPEDHQPWRRSPIRLESQVARDAILSLAGTLDSSVGGPPVPAQAGPARRSLCFFRSNNGRNLSLTTFDEAPVKECYRREPSIVPQQGARADEQPARARRRAAGRGAAHPPALHPGRIDRRSGLCARPSCCWESSRATWRRPR